MNHEGKIRYDIYSNHPPDPRKTRLNHFHEPTEVITPWYKKLWNWQPKESLALRLIEDFDIHGIKYTVQKDRHIVERAFWVLIQIASLSAAIYMSYDVVLMYQDSPVIVSFQPSQTPISDIPFPAITICNANPFRKSSFDNAVEILKAEMQKPLPNETIVHIYETILRQLDHMCHISDSFSVKFSYSLNETTTNLCKRGIPGLDNCDGKKAKPSIVSNMSSEQQRLISQSYQTCGEMIPKCIWEGGEQNCSKIFTPVITDFGICCVFNMMPRDVLVDLGDADIAADLLFTSDISENESYFWSDELNFDNLLNNKPTSETTRYLKYQTKAGQPIGLSFILDPEINETFCSSHDSYGFRVLAHSAIDYPQVSDFGIAVAPSSEVFLSLQAEVTKAEPDIQNIDLEKRNCYYSNEFKLESFKEYSWGNCISECIGKLISDNCSCSRVDMPQTVIKSHQFCEGESFDCAEDVKVKIANEGTKSNCPMCRPSCNRIEYKVASSAIPTRNDVNLWLKDGVGEKWSGKNVTIVHAFFSSDTVYSRVRKRIFSSNELFANVGGILGLFLGFSVISAVEPIYFLYRIWCDKKSKRVQTGVTTGSSANANISPEKPISISAGIASLDSFSTQYYNKLHLHGRIPKKAQFSPYPFLN